MKAMASDGCEQLLHDCHIFNIWDNSYRMREHQHGLRSASEERCERVAGSLAAAQRCGAIWLGLRWLRSLRPANNARSVSTGRRSLSPRCLSPKCAVFSSHRQMRVPRVRRRWRVG